jgi:phosphotransferase system enzyme I (PtsI)
MAANAMNLRLHGVAASPGIAIGRAHLLDRKKVEVSRVLLAEEQDIVAEMDRFREAIKRTQRELRDIRDTVRDSILEEHLHILDAHIRMMKDKTLSQETLKRIREERINAEWALSKALDKFRDILLQAEDEYLRSRVTDLDFVGQRILRQLKGEKQESISQIQEEAIVVAHDLSPADTAQMNKAVIRAFVTDMGGRTSHTAIMARSLEIPAVVGLERVTEMVRSGAPIVVDGMHGIVVVDPTPDLLDDYRTRRNHYRMVKEELLAYGRLPGETRDGFRVAVQANIEFPEEVPSVIRQGGEGIGLYRTEFLYLNREDLPTEDEHYRTYAEVVQQAAPRPVTIRTLDIGGDKLPSKIPMPEESNPALGLRAIRYSIKEREIFKTQLRGILRASIHGQVRIIFPMISGPEEIRSTKEVFQEVKAGLQQDGVPFDPNIPIGVMIEIPSAASVADLLAQEVDFFSIGTNDLIQYALAIDRANEHVVYLYEPLHPAVLRMIKWVVEAGHEAGIPVGMCGEMAGESLYIPILLGLGLDELSMNALAIPLVKKMIRSVTLGASRALTDRVFEHKTADEIRHCVFQTLFEWFPDEFQLLANGGQEQWLH